MIFNFVESEKESVGNVSYYNITYNLSVVGVYVRPPHYP